MGASMAQPDLVPVPGLVSAWLSQKNDTERLGKAGRGQASDHGQPRDRGGTPDRDARQADACKSADVNEEFAHEPVQRRQTADGHGPGEKHGCSPRHPSYESAQVVDIPCAGRMDHRAGAKEKQPLEEGVVEHMKEPAGQSQDRESRLMKGQSQHA